MARWWVLPLALLMAACTSLPAAPTPVPPTATAVNVPTKRAAQAARAIRLARAALAKRVGVPIEQVELVAWNEDTFPLENLGCPGGPEPERGRPAMVHGYEVTLRVGSDEYVYRVAGRRVVLCRGPK